MNVNKILKFRNKNIIMDKIIENKLLNQGLCIPSQVKLGKNISLPHNSVGTVIHPDCKIDDNVKIYQNVTIGRADIYAPIEKSKMKEIHIKKGAILCAGAKILSKEETLTVGENTIVGANAVLLNSTGDNEIWGGIPARKIGIRKKI